MDNHKGKNPSDILRLLPSIDALLQTRTAQKILPESGAKYLTELARTATDLLREEIRTKITDSIEELNGLSRERLLESAEDQLNKIWQREQNKKLIKVINATGVIIHTNLGRAPISAQAQKAIIEEASRYCSLEYDVETGKRGKRGERAARLLAEITGAEDALIVNNCAAAAFLVLTALCKGGEAIVSRGELVEIGGDFRIPDIMEQSGAILKEVGTTNRTKIVDYEKAINEQTKMLVKVHPSNYRIVGFTSAPSVSELAELAKQNDIIFYEDAGSGAIFDLSEYDLTDEPIITESIKAGVDIVTFSGDKLLGGVQAGLIVGKKKVVEKLRKHPFYRALRGSKFVYAILEATLESFRRETQFEEIPVLKMLSISQEELEKRTKQFADNLSEISGENHNLQFEIIKGKSAIGGGSAPTVHPETTLLSILHKEKSVNELEKSLRLSKPSIVVRILEDKILIDLRTVSEMEEQELLLVLAKL